MTFGFFYFNHNQLVTERIYRFVAALIQKEKIPINCRFCPDTLCRNSKCVVYDIKQAVVADPSQLCSSFTVDVWALLAHPALCFMWGEIVVYSG